MLTSYQRGELRKTASSYLEKNLNVRIRFTVDEINLNYKVDEQVNLKYILVSDFEYSNQIGLMEPAYDPDLPRDGILIKNDTIYLLPQGAPHNGTIPEGKHFSVDSKSGNWRMKLVQLNIWGYQVTFTRLKIAPNQPEIFPMEIAYKPTYFYGIVKEYDAIDFSVDFPDAEASIGKLKASIKDSVHTLKQGDEVPNAVEYIESVENTRGNVKYEWKTSPDTSQPGVQEAKIVVSDDSGRTLEVTVPITIMPLPLEMLPKAGEHKVIQYGAVPKAADYFNVVNHYEESTYKIEWVKAPDMNQEGVQTCLAKATSSDGRTADSAVQIEVISNPGLEVKLKPLEERILGVSYPSLSSNFKNYIEEVTLLGEKVDVNELELVVDETTDTNFQTIGQKEVNITVKKKTSEASVWIKGTGTTTVNVLWGNTILMRSIDGHSAGAFTLDVSNSNTDSAALSIRQGLESPLNVAVGKLQDPFKLYYRLDILRNERTIYTQEVTNRATLQEIMNAFGDKENKIEVKIDDIIQITHPGKTANSSVVMIDEEEKDFTYGTENARYRVTAYGLDPAPVITAESARVFFLGEDINQLNPQEFIKNIRLNDQLTSNEQYKINLIDGGDTRTVGKQTMRVNITTKDGLVSEEVEVTYQVKWGDTFVLKGLKESTVGAFSLLKSNDQWQIKASQGVEGTELDEPVNNYFGRGTFYSIEILQGTTNKFRYEVIGNQSIRESIYGFNEGKPLDVNEGDVIKVYHADSVGKNLLMKDELVKDYTMGSDYAYYEVTEYGLEPILAVAADSMPQEFTLGEDSSNVDGSKLINSITVNGTIVASNLYTVKQMSDFDTSVAGSQTIKVRIDTKDGLVSKELDVPYEVKWGKTILIKAQNGQSAGAFSLYAGTSSTNRVLVFNQGLKTDLKTPISTDSSLYYSIEIVREGRSVYSQEIPGYATLEEVMANFGSKQKLNVQAGDIIKLYHPQRSDGSSVLLVNEIEKDYTYGSPYANYRITSYGFEPMPVIETVGPNKVFSLMENTQNIDLSQLLANITINGERVESKNYKITQLSKMDTSTVGKREVKLNLKPEDGSADIELDVPYEVAWGSTIQLKNQDGDTVGAYSLIKENKQIKLRSLQGEDGSDLSNRITEYDDMEIYYGIEVFTNNSSKYKYEVRGTQTIEQSINRFNSGEPLKVSVGDQIKVYHADPSGNVLMAEEEERNYTYGSNYAYYNVTEYGFEPTGDFTVTPAEAKIVIDTKRVDLKNLLKEVKVNGKELPKTAYTVALDPETEIDTSSRES
ncbi:wall-associated protein [Enterococcus hirae ATCC 9790]|uniref:Wall-associated protein n=1 Tax=Enterococcus hirae (strain ATCC 9790 / DSM 20160 / JCM 8729 / LMG 6399 / NBRC 3181 / NCIMB 6459 / NCDO 1258 / NCTC 12367 / WDCM 00089 / R) TaxID=768486 RepID=I6SEU7_ENTHA|nr:wall-associated protein [Enterococcus hirae ATCC 9790]